MRDKFSSRLKSVGSSVESLLQGYRLLATLVRPTSVEAISRDPDDNHVLACALTAGARLIVTRDDDLLTLGTFKGMLIKPAREALSVIPERPV